MGGYLTLNPLLAIIVAPDGSKLNLVSFISLRSTRNPQGNWDTPDERADRKWCGVLFNRRTMDYRKDWEDIYRQSIQYYASLDGGFFSHHFKTNILPTAKVYSSLPLPDGAGTIMDFDEIYKGYSQWLERLAHKEYPHDAVFAFGRQKMPQKEKHTVEMEDDIERELEREAQDMSLVSRDGKRRYNEDITDKEHPISYCYAVAVGLLIPYREYEPPPSPPPITRRW